MRNTRVGLLSVVIGLCGLFLAGCPFCNGCDGLSGEYFSVVYRLSPENRVGGSAVVRSAETYNADGTGYFDVLRPDGVFVEDVPFAYDVVECGEFTSERSTVPTITIALTGLFNPRTDYIARVGHALTEADMETLIGFGFRLPRMTPTLLGDYVLVDVHSDPADMVIEAHRHEMVFHNNGTGTLLGATLEDNVNFSFSVEPNGQLDIVEDEDDVNLMDGFVSQGGRSFAAVDNEAGEDGRIGIQIGFRRSTHMCRLAVAGEYQLVALHDTAASEPWVMRGVLTLDAKGGGTVVEVATGGLGMPAPRAVTYALNAAGEVTLTFTDDGEVSEGIVSEDADAIILADYTQVEAADTTGLMFCVRQP